MKSYEIHFGDWARTFFGEVPDAFYVELIIRALAVYLILTVSMRLMGKRMSSQLSRNELAALVSLAAAVGVPMMAPNRGLLPAVIIAAVVISIQRFIAARAARSQSFEKRTQGNVSIIVEDSVLAWAMLKKVNIAREEVFTQLRAQGVLQLGEVERFYMEANGAFTLIKNEPPRPGLCIVPNADKKLQNEMRIHNGQTVCSRCGYPTKEPAKPCPVCTDNRWVHAVSED